MNFIGKKDKKVFRGVKYDFIDRYLSFKDWTDFGNFLMTIIQFMLSASIILQFGTNFNLGSIKAWFSTKSKLTLIVD